AYGHPRDLHSFPTRRSSDLKDYVDAARAIGAKPSRILFRTILPNSVATLIVQATVSFASAVLLESSLSFLGLGVPLPAPSWGSIDRKSTRLNSSHVKISYAV